MDLGLRGRVAVVTGSSQGIGRATAILLAQEGARVAITYRSHRDKAEDVAARVRDFGTEAVVLPFDLVSEESIRGAMTAVVDRWGRVDVLVNNAVQWASESPAGGAPFDEQPFEDLRAQLRANVEGTMAATHAAVTFMRRKQWGRIVTVSSELAVQGAPGSTAYSAAKSALHGMTRALFAELASEGILAVVMAGLTLTERVQARMSPRWLEQAANRSPLRRLPAPEEVASTIVFLASAANTTVNGEIVLSSGGHS